MYRIRKDGKKIGSIVLKASKSQIQFSCRREEKDSLPVQKLREDLEKLGGKSGQAGAAADWKEKVLEKLKALGYELEEDHSGEMQIRMEIPLDHSGRVLADFGPVHPECVVSEENRLLQEDIARTMFPKIQAGCRKELGILGSQIKTFAEQDDYEQMERLLDLNQIRGKVLLAGGDPGASFVDALYQIDAKRICPEKRKDLRLLRIGWGLLYQERRIAQDAEALLAVTEREDERFQYYLAVGCVYSWERKYTAAIQVFQDLMKHCDSVKPGDQGWLYYDLAQVYYLKKDYRKGISLFLKAGDIWSGGGDQNQAAMAYQNMIYGMDKLDTGQALAFVREQEKRLENLPESGISLRQKERLADWLYGKAQICYKRNEMEEAIASLDASVACTRQIAGLEAMAVRALKCKKHMLQEMGRSGEKLEEIDRQVEYLEPYIQDEEALLEMRMEELLRKKDPGEDAWRELEQEVKESRFPRLKATFLAMQVARYLPDQPNKALACLDEACQMELEDEKRVAILNLYALVMAQKGDEQQEYQYLLETVPYLRRGLLVEPERFWALARKYGTAQERLEILYKMKECLPDLEGADLQIARELMELKHFPEAYRILEEVRQAGVGAENRNEKEQEELERLLREAAMGMAGQAEGYLGMECQMRAKGYPGMGMAMQAEGYPGKGYPMRAEESPVIGHPIGEQMSALGRRPENGRILDIKGQMEAVLLGFKKEVEGQYVAGFWKVEQGKRTWISHPEKRAQELLRMYLRCSLEEEVTVLEEVPVDQGRMDILIQIPPSIRVVIELKMCGCGYSSTYTRHAIGQTADYMEKVKAHIGFVLVLDGRSRDQGKGIEESGLERGKEIRVILVDVQPRNPSTPCQ